MPFSSVGDSDSVGDHGATTATVSNIFDPARLSALRASGLLGREAEAVFDRLTRLAVRLAGVPAAFLSLVDAERDFYLSACGFGEPLASTRELTGLTFCHYVIQADGPIVIPDTAADARYHEVPTVHSLGVAAYVGIPIRTAEGYVLGSFCAIDLKPRAWTAAEVELLTELAASAEREIALRAAARTARQLLDAAEAERQRLAAVLDAFPIGVVIADAAGRVTGGTAEAERVWAAATNRAGCRQSIADYGALHAARRDTGALLEPHDWPLGRALRCGEASTLEIELLPVAGPALTVLASGAPVRDAAGQIVGAVEALIDLTARVALEDRLRQAQKMEAVGQLAGGIAHDFNNLLMVITGTLECVLEDLPREHPVRPMLDDIGRAGERARTLVRQLLVFSRKQAVHTRCVDVNESVRGAEKLLRRALGEEIQFDVHLAGDLGPVRADPGQLEQVLFNLAINARDAMLTAAHGHPGTGGTLSLETAALTLTPADAAAWDGIAPGRVVRLQVRDTGHGMDAATQAHAFEPFFTTKAVGAGTGLGLATVFGIVRLAGGAIRLESAPGAGTTVTVLLPVAETEAGATADSVIAAVPAGCGTVLLVEDESTVRVITRRMLERRGFVVLEARHGADALMLWRSHLGRIDAVVTDLRMPEMSGPEFVAVLRREAPELPVVYITGYTEQGAVSVRGPHEAIVEKPFTSEGLLVALQHLLPAHDRPGG